MNSTKNDKSDPAMRPILDIRNLVTEFRTDKGVFTAVDDVSLKLYPGRTLCLVGESGSGKSVLSRSILQIVDRPGKIKSGQILMRRGESNQMAEGDVIDLAALAPRGNVMRGIRGSDIAMIFQEPMSSLSPVHAIGDQIGESIRLHEGIGKKEAKARAIEMLRKVEIPRPELAVDRYPFEFSGGMRQRAMIAMALACNPKVLIADEPTTALDVTIQAEILELIGTLKETRQMAVLFITHDMGVVAQVADEVAVMRFGKLLETGDVYDIFSRPEHDYTRSLLEAARDTESPSPRRLQMRQENPVGRPILVTENLCKEFVLSSGFLGRNRQSLLAVNNANIELYEGENLGIVGESGSGKTTLARCIQRIHSVDSGKILYRDKSGQSLDLAQMSNTELAPAWRDIRVVFQDPFGSLNPRMTVEQIIGEPLLLSGMKDGRQRRDRIRELLGLVGLPAESMQRYPHAFSGGQRQRISIARAIAPKPRIIIADEATSALDVSIRTHIMDLLLDLQVRLNLSYIFISHDVGLVRYFCDRVVVMYGGKVVETGETEAVCTQPQHPYTRSLLSAVPVADPCQRTLHSHERYVEQAARAG
ncbi:ABC transporter ATP-binding protein [Granulosicoccus sp. 3-233]|uniref:ABC transporter ATP-binding protein n=1 Tax=Granulosicoccus sp. 3-233 TaxID=3417969 RepID=UPI003D34A376